ncbi:enoyl-CoA hydratase/isomerase family protein [Phaeocystidibacter marisrubri]|uniref:Enoyl-CoA hydratase n=1 Tax=Phaeocystidibacter marisrubri TaxID=1577780 RepID=A0A6L3ZFL7_9FLAO|nr:enoyl-CoA hydratase-related protein [Phaeocystidibacter marisrubri]KAB2816540.1 enoyl-CoA hydratase [Phaeocystidibacter marisrubri]GGH69573.1 enoyl-CoA hydratase [Phaeocystidibacter marisrubri]
MEDLVLVAREGKIATVTINRPNQLNALNGATIAALSSTMVELESDDDVRVIILTGSGEKSFVAGADIKEFANYSVEEGKELARKGHETLFNLIENLKKPVIAAVNGFALGGGLELAMSCHVRVASDNARMGLPEVSLGVIPGYGGTQRLPQLVGKGKAMEMIMTAGMIKADDALQWGLVNYVVSQDQLMEKCVEIASKTVANSGVAIATAMKAVNAGFQTGVNGFEAEIDAFGEAFGTDEFSEGTTAFIEKRKPEFK